MLIEKLPVPNKLNDVQKDLLQLWNRMSQRERASYQYSFPAFLKHMGAL